ncbi:MAG: HD domain-containing protein [Oscillospiraceae bacterium]|jgi:3'-5' exoribonuclease|nr:HD domain-containing protein [Oscillospiraceae bacterium]
MKFNELDKQGTVDGFALVKVCDKKTAKNGSVYLDMILADAKDEINAKLWDYKEGSHPEVELNTVVRIRGQIQQYNNQPQLRVDRIRPAVDADNIDMADYVPAAEYTSEFMMGEIRKVVAAFSDESLKKLTTAILDEYADRLMICPAAFRLHHAMRGGLLYHVLSIIRLAQGVCRVYPSIDKDLLLTGVILHDVAKTEEFELSASGLVDKYTTEGMLVGHLVRGAIAVERVGTEQGIPKETLMLVQHMLISHHGEPEYGAAVRPAFLEAEILSQLDLLDARVYEITKIISELVPGDFSNRIWSLDDRKMFNHGRKVTLPEAKLEEA